MVTWSSALPGLVLLGMVVGFAWLVFTTARRWWRTRQVPWRQLLAIAFAGGGLATLGGGLLYVLMVAVHLDTAEYRIRNADHVAVLRECTVLMDGADRLARERGLPAPSSSSDLMLTNAVERRELKALPHIRELKPGRVHVGPYKVDLIMSSGHHRLALHCCRPPGECYGGEVLTPGVTIVSF
jgi:hypothetical protein